MADNLTTDSLAKVSDLGPNSTFLNGETPKDIQQICLNVCQKYLSGIWRKQTEDSIEVTRLTGGNINQIYLCRIIDGNKIDTNQPKEVIVRLYGTKYKVFNSETLSRFNDHIIAALISELNLGPKVYGVFEQGQLLKYYKV